VLDDELELLDEELLLDDELLLEDELELLLLSLLQTAPVTAGISAGVFCCPLLPCIPTSTKSPAWIVLFQPSGVAV
jgi:hypothetical protein